VKKKLSKKKKQQQTNKENLVSENVIMFLTHPFNLFSAAFELARYIGDLVHGSQVFVLTNHIFKTF